MSFHRENRETKTKQGKKQKTPTAKGNQHTKPTRKSKQNNQNGGMKPSWTTGEKQWPGSLCSSSRAGHPLKQQTTQKHHRSDRPTFFFCSNAIIALARSWCKCLLAVLITASEAKAVIASTRGVESYDVIPHGENPKTDTGKQEKQQQTKTAKPKSNKKHHTSRSWNEVSKSYAWNVMTRQLMCPVLSRSSLKQQLKAKHLKDDRGVPSKKVAVPKTRIPPARIPEIASRSRAGITSTNAHRTPRYA